ncbi:MAG: hypothetical protein SchgKO_02990 [Schleiferiaceae bacterium]
MKKFITTVLALSLGLTTWAQKDTIRMNVNGSEVIILSDNVGELSEIDLNKMIAEINRETAIIIADYQRRITEIETQRANGEMTSEEAEEAIEEASEEMEDRMEEFEDRWEDWGENYESTWEEWGENYGEQWEEWAEQWEREAEKWEEDREAGKDVGSMPPMPPMPALPPVTAEPNEEIIIRTTKKKHKRRHRQMTKGTFDIHLGLSQMVEGGGGLIFDEPAEQETWKSSNFEIGFGGKSRIAGENSKFYVKYGLAFNWNWFTLKGKNIMYKDTATGMINFGENGTSLNVARSRVSLWYMDIPVMFQYDASERGMDNSFTLGVGGYGGVKFYSRRNIEYDDLFNDRSSQYTYNQFFMPAFRYGLIGQVGYSNFKLTAKYDLNAMFKDGKGPDYHVASVTLGFSW